MWLLINRILEALRLGCRGSMRSRSRDLRLKGNYIPLGMGSKGDERWEYRGLQPLRSHVGWKALGGKRWAESVGRGSAYSHPPTNHLKLHGWLGEAGQWNPGQNGASKLLGGTRIHEHLGDGKGHKQKTCRTSEFFTDFSDLVPIQKLSRNNKKAAEW